MRQVALQVPGYGSPQLIRVHWFGQECLHTVGAALLTLIWTLDVPIPPAVSVIAITALYDPSST